MSFFRHKNTQANQYKGFTDQARDPVEFLQLAIDYHIRDYAEKRDHNRKYAFRVKMYSVMVAALTTVTLGLASSPLFTGSGSFWSGGAIPYLTVFALFLSASVTVVSSWEAFAGYDWKWVRYRTTLAELYQLKDDFFMSKLSGKPATDKSYETLKWILQDVNVEWANRRALPETQPAAPKKEPRRQKGPTQSRPRDVKRVESKRVRS